MQTIAHFIAKVTKVEVDMFEPVHGGAGQNHQ